MLSGQCFRPRRSFDPFRVGGRVAPTPRGDASTLTPEFGCSADNVFVPVGRSTLSGSSDGWLRRPGVTRVRSPPAIPLQAFSLRRLHYRPVSYFITGLQPAAIFHYRPAATSLPAFSLQPFHNRLSSLRKPFSFLSTYTKVA